MDQHKQEILAALGGIPEAVYDAIVASFYEEAKTHLAVIKEALVSYDMAIIAKSAHSIKGSSGNLRLTSIQEVAKQLENAAKSNDQGQVNSLVNQLTTLVG